MPSRRTTVALAALLTTLLAGCQQEKGPQSGAWSFGDVRTDAGGEGADAAPGDDVDESPRGLQLIDLEGTEWTRYLEGAAGASVKREYFRAGDTIDRDSELRVEGQETRVTELPGGRWETLPNGHVRIVYDFDDEDGPGGVFEQRMPRVGFRSEEVDGWFEVPEAEQGERMRWLPGSYLAEDTDRRRRFRGRFLIDFSPRPAFGNTLMETRVAIAFDRPLDAIAEGGECRVTVDLTARGRYSNESVCQTERTLETSCRVVSKGEGIEAIGLGYGTEPAEAAEAWEEVEPDLPDDSYSCEAAAEVFHGFFTPLFYRVASRPNILFTAPVGRLARRWVRYRVE
jgi:hypothetical protein